MDKFEFADHMNVVAAQVGAAIRDSRRAGLPAFESCLGAVIGVLSVIRVEGLPEDRILKMAIEAMPTKRQMESIAVIGGNGHGGM